MEELQLIGRKKYILKNDIKQHENYLKKEVEESSFLVIGGAGTIGQAVVKEIFKRSPKKLHVVDISENNLVELVRDLRSSFGYIEGDFQTFTIDVDSEEYDYYFESQEGFDYILNLSALKHVRNEKDPYTLMRMIRVNILNTVKTLNQNKSLKKYFAVSTDKATNPINMMGGSKFIMEQFLMQFSKNFKISTARFANVAFSDGSLLCSFQNRIEKKQPIVAPYDVERYFILPQEAGELCLLSCILGENRDIFFPKLTEEFKLVSFKQIAINFITSLGMEPYICTSEEEARDFDFDNNKNKWPCYFFASDTTGEKEFEEFYTDSSILDLVKYQSLGVIKNNFIDNSKKLNDFIEKINQMIKAKNWDKKQIVSLFKEMIPDFNYYDKNKYLESKM